MNTWKFDATVDGNDIVVSNTIATWFGGDEDVESGQDNGLTASGVKTAGNPNCMGCALPVEVYDAARELVRSTCDSPLARDPHIPWKTMVQVTRGIQTITVPLIDNGPSKSSGHGLDLTQAAFRALGVPVRVGTMTVSYRVLGAAKWLSGAKWQG